MTGVVINTLAHRGFSFILDDATGQEVFAHSSDYPDGQIFPRNTKVSFDVIPFRGRSKATNIREIVSKPHANGALTARLPHATPKDVTGGSNER
jgi:cold shock CspA family protein